MSVAMETGTKVLYETVDLVPEYAYRGERHRQESLSEERRLIGEVDGFVTAADSYADYYMEKYVDVLDRRPVVRDNMPDRVVAAPKRTDRPLRILFLGSLMFDRPVYELIESMGLVSADATLHFQGKNYLGTGPLDRIAELGLQSRVHVVEPCPPEQIVETAAAFDVGIVALRGDNENERRASTSKLFTYMAAGLAILGSDLPGISRVVSQYHNGVLVQGMEPESWAGAISRLAALEKDTIDDMRRASLDAALEHSWDRQRPEFIGEFVRAVCGGLSTASSSASL